MRSIFVMRRVVKQLVKDKRTLGLLIFAPLFVLFLLYTIFNSEISMPDIEAVGMPGAMVAEFEAAAAVTVVTGEAAAMDDLKYHRTDAVVVYSDPDITVHVEGSDVSITGAVKKAVASAMSSYMKTHVQETAEQTATEQQQRVRDKIDAQIASIQYDIASEIEAQQRRIQSDMEAQIEEQVETMKSTMQNEISSQLRSALRSQISAAIAGAAAQQRAALQEQLSAYQAGVMQAISQQVQSYSVSVRQAVDSYLAQAGASGSGAAFDMPAFTMPVIAPPVISIPEISVSLGMPSIDLSDIKMPSVSLPEISAPEVNSADIEVPDIRISVEVADITYSYINGSDDMGTFDTIAPYLMGFFVFFFVFIIAGISFLRERISGTLDRVLATPIRRYQIVLGYFIGFGIFVFIQTVLIQVFMVYALNLAIKGSFMLVLLTNLLLATGSLALGTLLSAFARNEMQLFQFIPVVIVPQMVFCGIFSLREAPLWVQALSKVFPLTYGAQALSDIAIRGLGFADIAVNLAVLAFFTVLFLALNTLVLKKYRRL
jgi:ABC-type multidrug transport system, permease component